MRRSAVIAAFAAFAVATAAASSEKGRSVLTEEKKLEDVKRQIREETEGLRLIETKEKSVLGHIEEINRKIVEKAEKISRIEVRVRKVEKDIGFIGIRIKRLERERDLLSTRLESRLSAIYKMRRGEALRAVFSAESVTDLGRRHKYLSMIMSSDMTLMEKCVRNLRDLEAEKDKYVSLKADMDLAVAELRDGKREAEAAEAEKRAMLAGIQRERSRREDVVRELAQAAEELSRLIRDLKKDAEEEIDGGFAAMKGRLEMPVDGSIVSTYGKVMHPRFKTVTFNNGIVIEAPEGAVVRSIYPGKVIYVGWLKGYGQIMIVDNGGGFYTLFGYLQKALKEKGDGVEKGEEIALVGNTGLQASPGLYFEIRQKGVPRDPSAWFSAKR